MKIKFLFIAFFVVASFAQADIGKKIKLQSKYLKLKDNKEKKITVKLNDLANEILKQINGLKQLKEKIDNLDKSIESNQANVIENSKKLNILLQKNKKLLFQKEDLEKKIIDIVAKNFSYYLIGNKNTAETKNSIIADEIVVKMDVILREEFKKLSQNYEKINGKISIRKKEIQYIQKDIDNSKKQKNRLLLLKKKMEIAIKKLNREKLNYKNRLNKINRDKKTIREALEKLKILKKREEIKTKKENGLRKRVKKQGKTKLSVRQIGSSYQASKVKRYRGKKTIAPLKSYVVKRKFGNYIDPIYNIKIFNDSVTLSSKIKNAKVRNIFNGKVVFAKDTAVLDKVIIIENSRGIHTVYAHLSKIAPTIKVGKKIKKGYIIGRVKYDLIFEVTQKNYHINPLEVIFR